MLIKWKQIEKCKEAKVKQIIIYHCLRKHKRRKVQVKSNNFFYYLLNLAHVSGTVKYTAPPCPQVLNFDHYYFLYIKVSRDGISLLFMSLILFIFNYLFI